MNRQEKIDAIYEKIADKTLSSRCKVFRNLEINGEKIYDYYNEYIDLKMILKKYME